MKPSIPAPAERLIGALLLGPLPRPTPAVAPLPSLPAPSLSDPHVLPVLELARLDRSGRLSARAVLRRLRWEPGHRVDVDVVDRALLVSSAADGAHVVGSRGDLGLPAASRALCGITDAVVMAAYVSDDVVVIHSVVVVARLLRQLHVGMAARDAG